MPPIPPPPSHRIRGITPTAAKKPPIPPPGPVTTNSGPPSPASTTPTATETSSAPARPRNFDRSILSSGPSPDLPLRLLLRWIDKHDRLSVRLRRDRFPIHFPPRQMKPAVRLDQVHHSRDCPPAVRHIRLNLPGLRMVKAHEISLIALAAEFNLNRHAHHKQRPDELHISIHRRHIPPRRRIVISSLRQICLQSKRDNV